MTATAQDVLDLLVGLRQGAALEEYAESVSELLEAVRKTGKGGSIQFTLKVAPISAADSVTLTIDDALTLKAPKLPAGSTVMYRTEDGRLSRRDPRQPELPGLREVSREAPAEVREIANG